MPTALKTIPRTWAGDVAVQGSDCTAALRAQQCSVAIPTVATTGTTEVLLHTHGAGSITLVRVVFKDALTANDTNFVTFTLTNKGQLGVGTTAILASSPAGVNTTKVTGGAGLVAYGTKVLTLSATAGNLVVAAGDVLALSIAATNTLANTLTEGHLKILVDQLG